MRCCFALWWCCASWWRVAVLGWDRWRLGRLPGVVCCGGSASGCAPRSLAFALVLRRFVSGGWRWSRPLGFGVRPCGWCLRLSCAGLVCVCFPVLALLVGWVGGIRCRRAGPICPWPRGCRCGLALLLGSWPRGGWWFVLLTRVCTATFLVGLACMACAWASRRLLGSSTVSV